MMALAGLALMLVGFGFKIAAVPFQWWTPDVYQGAPTSVTAFMSVGAKAAGFAALTRVLQSAFSPVFTIDWMIAAAVLAALTMTVGNLAALAQKDVKRMLGYSSIAHAGYILIGVAAANETGMHGVLFYLLTYTFMSVGAFAVACVVERREGFSTVLSDYAGLSQREPLLAAAMAVFMLSLTGIPPLVGFWGKLYVFQAAVEANMSWLAILGVINSAISLFYYLGVVVQMYMRHPTPVPPPSATGPAITLAHRCPRRPFGPGRGAISVAILLAAVATVALGIWPGAIINLVMWVPFG
jgi:NADH-quinone oxidoreductase subunit N